MTGATWGSKDLKRGVRDTLAAVKEWEAGVARFPAGPTPAALLPGEVAAPGLADDAFFRRGAALRGYDQEGEYWRTFAEWVIAREARAKGVRPLRSMEKFPNGAGDWAWRIRIRGLDGRGGEEVQRFVTFIAMSPDATRGRKTRTDLEATARDANEARAKEAKARDAAWKKALVRAGHWPIGRNITLKDAAHFIADAFVLDPAKVASILRKRRSQNKL